MRLSNEAIAAAARERLGCVDARVFRYQDRQSFVGTADFGILTDCCGGEFYALAVKANGDAPFEVIARRRTLAELLTVGTQRRN